MRVNYPKKVETGILFKVFLLLSYLAMVTVNALANILPINGQRTGEVSDAYANLFAPAGITFSIWGVIYFLLAMHTLYQLGLFQKDHRMAWKEKTLLEKVGLYFILSSLLNTAWVFAWHYEKMLLSLALIVLILISLIIINKKTAKAYLTPREKLFVRLPFSIYFGWITVATIANATVFLVSIGWDGFGFAEATWAVIMIAAGLLIGLLVMIKNSDMAYGLVLLWAYLGILIKHTSALGFQNRYPEVIITVIVCLVFLLLAEAYLLFFKQQDAY